MFGEHPIIFGGHIFIAVTFCIHIFIIVGFFFFLGQPKINLDGKHAWRGPSHIFV